MVCTTGWHLPWIQSERTVREVNDHVKARPYSGRAQTPEVQEYELYLNLTINITIIITNIYTHLTYLASTTLKHNQCNHNHIHQI